MFVEWSVRIVESPRFSAIMPKLTEFVGTVGSTETREPFRQSFHEGAPIGSPTTIAPEEVLDDAWMMLGPGIVVQVVLSTVPGLDDEAGTWCGVIPSRIAGSRLFAATIGASIAASLRVTARDETNALRLWRDFAPDAFDALLRTVTGTGFQAAERKLIGDGS